MTSFRRIRTQRDTTRGATRTIPTAFNTDFVGQQLNNLIIEILMNYLIFQHLKILQNGYLKI